MCRNADLYQHLCRDTTVSQRNCGTTPIGEFLANGPKCPVGWTRSRAWELTPDRLVKEIIAPLQPTHLVMSCGIWKDTRSSVYWEALRLAGESLSARTQCIWRTSGVHGPRYTPFFQRLEAAYQKIRRGAFNLVQIDSRRAGLTFAFVC